jgi:hypothetical protein
VESPLQLAVIVHDPVAVGVHVTGHDPALGVQLDGFTTNDWPLGPTPLKTTEPSLTDGEMLAVNVVG